jgi:hypothetical protein
LELHNQIVNNNIIIQQLFKDVQTINAIMYTGLIIGSALMEWGYHQWYFRIQKYLDYELQKKIDVCGLVQGGRLYSCAWCGTGISKLMHWLIELIRSVSWMVIISTYHNL